MLQAHVEYETTKRHYAHVDCPGHADYVKVCLEFSLFLNEQWIYISIFAVFGCIPCKVHFTLLR